MLTRKQRWRRVRGGRFVEACSSSPSPSRDSGSAGRQRRPHPIDALSIGDSLLHLLGSSAAGGKPSEAARESDSAAAESPAKKKQAPGSGRVHFNHQVRVVLVPCRTELGGLKGDIWWGEDDYLDFRREYILAVRAKMAGLGDEEKDSSTCTADDITAAAAAAAAATKSEAKAEGAQAEVSDPVSRQGAGGNDNESDCDNDDDVSAPAPLRRQERCLESAPLPPPPPSPALAARAPPAEAAPRTATSSTPAVATEAPKTPTFSCAFSTPEGGAGDASGSVTMTTAPDSSSNNSSSPADPAITAGGSRENTSVGVGAAAAAGGTGSTTVVVTAISQDALAAAAAAVAAGAGRVVGPAQAVVSPESDNGKRCCSSPLPQGCGPDGVEEGLMTPAVDTVAMAEEAVVAAGEGLGVVETVGTSARREGIVENVKDEVEVSQRPKQTPPRPSSSSCSTWCSRSTCCSARSHSFSMLAAEKFIEDAAAGGDDDDEEEEGYRTQSTSSVSDHTDAESDFDTDEGEGEDRPEQAETAVRKNIERPPRLPYRR